MTATTTMTATTLTTKAKAMITFFVYYRQCDKMLLPMLAKVAQNYTNMLLPLATVVCSQFTRHVSQ